jgi:MoxR-like ATPase
MVFHCAAPGTVQECAGRGAAVASVGKTALWYDVAETHPAAMNRNDALLADWHSRALHLEEHVKRAVIGQDRVVRLVNVAVFARGHVLLEGDVGVGKTTLLRAFARGIGGDYERVEGTVDLMPADLIYHTFVNEDGKPRVDPGPLLRHGSRLSIFFFNEINRARPQVHSLLLRAMAERSVSAFNREFHFPHLQVFADRNRVEKEETFEITAAARDRFLLEVGITTPEDPQLRRALMFDPAFHDTEALIARVGEAVLPYEGLNAIAEAIQRGVQASPALEDYALKLWQATREPEQFGVSLPGVSMRDLILAGASPRGMSMLLRAARVLAWLDGRGHVVPEDLQGVFPEAVSHRVFFSPVYELRRTEIAPALTREILERVAAP